MIKTENIEYQQRLDAAVADMQAATTKEELAAARQRAENIIRADRRHSEEFLYIERNRLERATMERMEKTYVVYNRKTAEIKAANRRQYAAEQANCFRDAQRCCNAAWLAETLAVAKQRGIISDYSLTVPTETETERGGDNE